MGCSSSTDLGNSSKHSAGYSQNHLDPNRLYGKGHRNIPQSDTSEQHASIKATPLVNGNQSNINNGVVPTVTPESEKGAADNIPNGKENRVIKGDLSMYNDAKVQRERKLRERLMKRERLAQEMSDKVMEEKERLSLTSSRSRATSRATSPKLGRKGVASISDVTASTSREYTDASHAIDNGGSDVGKDENRNSIVNANDPSASCSEQKSDDNAIV